MRREDSFLAIDQQRPKAKKQIQLLLFIGPEWESCRLFVFTLEFGK